MNHVGIYIGYVEKVNDPEKLGRVKARVPLVYGTKGGTIGAVPMDDIPWAIPHGMPAGGSPLSGGMSWLPEVGDQVVVQFLDGEPEKPVWSWCMQTKPQAEKFELHAYADDAGKTGKPERAALTRYGHTVEWNAGSLIMTTSSGYRMVLLSGIPGANVGSITIATPMGQHQEFDDATLGASMLVTANMFMNIGSKLTTMARAVRFETMLGDFDVDAYGRVALKASLNIDLAAPIITVAGKLILTGGAVNGAVTSDDFDLNSLTNVRLTAINDLTLSAGGRTMTMTGGTINFA